MNGFYSMFSQLLKLVPQTEFQALVKRTHAERLLLDHDGYFPSVAVITAGRPDDVRVTHTLAFAPGTIVVLDRGYVHHPGLGS